MNQYDHDEDIESESQKISERRFIVWQDPQDENKTCGECFEYNESGEWVQI